MASVKKQTVLAHAAKKEKSLLKNIAHSLNPPTFRGVKNKGKIVAGRAHPGSGKKKSGKGKKAGVDRLESAPAAVGSVQYGGADRSSRIFVRQPTWLAISRLVSHTSTAFGIVEEWPLNIGNPALFPRACAQADIYEKFRFLSFEVKYDPAVSTQKAGMVGAYYDADPTDAPATNFLQATNNATSVKGSPWEPWVLKVPVRSGWLYTHNSAVASSGALARQENPGVLRIWTDGVDAATFCGSISVRYHVEFAVEKPQSSILLNGRYVGVPSTASNTTATKQYDLQASTASAYINRGFEALFPNPDFTAPSFAAQCGIYRFAGYLVMSGTATGGSTYALTLQMVTVKAGVTTAHTLGTTTLLTTTTPSWSAPFTFYADWSTPANNPDTFYFRQIVVNGIGGDTTWDVNYADIAVYPQTLVDAPEDPLLSSLERLIGREEKSEPPPTTRTFRFPVELSELTAWLGSWEGSVTCIPSQEESTHRGAEQLIEKLRRFGNGSGRVIVQPEEDNAWYVAQSTPAPVARRR